ncbi:hypothetical protein EMIHUDRAFT_240195 [Emiliania huxleyi CCMP1516]|uniref:Uncharacterized protein n=2 Tax=Emiliania huxleyi TaxID=2903 RepID=A0A0D3IHF3_EMIH1|nr:hypothetical protein EMIHUDRAFT_452629 [Emiliania huxleyi CCMP1516]XP_005774954.1 hypothetical protein EMIHUDRAFT_240195 [Emiliania huxleyi CCMP1516]EOD10688.1 hypothetical protein EMIHUDRAFT_452629 [Emiliania huxleyi CCMP1516]EOD22525.1 hypothetical protein EMIHUDRAFT_240195 [Emiliania huxleyi CCMP1516]|eukprot:XP_005763117.1 hypothetical protein EMIHUDRAFT_452629 [Emiliania huxleyi CCMP1516]
MLQSILALGALLAPHPVLRSRRIAVGMNEASQVPPSPVVSVVLPEGKAAGDLLLIQPPRGAQCQVVVPEGVAPGQSFSVQLPATVSAARRVRAKYGDDAAGFVDLSDSGERAKLSRLESDLAQFKAERGLADRRLAGGAAAELQEEEEATPLARVINTLGTVLTFNFFVIILFFAWFLTGVGLQFGAHDEAVMNTFRTAWDPLILPLLSTHMALTFLSAGLERLAKPAEEG